MNSLLISDNRFIENKLQNETGLLITDIPNYDYDNVKRGQELYSYNKNYIDSSTLPTPTYIYSNTHDDIYSTTSPQYQAYLTINYNNMHTLSNKNGIIYNLDNNDNKQINHPIVMDNILNQHPITSQVIYNKEIFQNEVQYTTHWGTNFINNMDTTSSYGNEETQYDNYKNMIYTPESETFHQDNVQSNFESKDQVMYPSLNLPILTTDLKQNLNYEIIGNDSSLSSSTSPPPSSSSSSPFPLIEKYSTTHEEQDDKKIRKKRQRKEGYKTKKQRELEMLRDNENSKPISQQLQENTIIWNKIKQTKKKGIYKCSHCTDIFSDLGQFAKHLDSFEVSRPYKCPFTDCPWSILGLPRKAEVRRHCATQHEYRIHTLRELRNKEESPAPITFEWECPYDSCIRTFKRKDSYKRHEKLVHLNPESRFNKRFKNLNNKMKTNEMNQVGLEDVNDSYATINTTANDNDNNNNNNNNNNNDNELLDEEQEELKGLTDIEVLVKYELFIKEEQYT